MAIAIFTGATSNLFELAGNWAPASIPVDGDTLIYNDQSTTYMTGGAPADKGFDVIVDKSFQYYIGTSGTPFAPAKGFDHILFSGNGTVSSYLNTTAGGAADIVTVFVDSPSSKDDVLVVGGAGAVENVIVRNGKAKVDATIEKKIQVLAGAAGSQAQLEVPAGNTLTGAEVGVMGGRFTCASHIETAIVAGGEFVLSGTADITEYLQMYGGVTYWDAFDTPAAASVLTLVDIFGGALRTRNDRQGRTITNLNVYASGLADFGIGGFGIVFTNAPRCFGDNMIRMPKGASVTFGI